MSNPGTKKQETFNRFRRSFLEKKLEILTISIALALFAFFTITELGRRIATVWGYIIVLTMIPLGAFVVYVLINDHKEEKKRNQCDESNKENAVKNGGCEDESVADN